MNYTVNLKFLNHGKKIKNFNHLIKKLLESLILKLLNVKFKLHLKF